MQLNFFRILVYIGWTCVTFLCINLNHPCECLLLILRTFRSDHRVEEFFIKMIICLIFKLKWFCRLMNGSRMRFSGEMMKLFLACVVLPRIWFLATLTSLAGADVNKPTTNNDHTVLSLACAGGHLNIVELLLKKGANASHKLKAGSCFLFCTEWHDCCCFKNYVNALHIFDTSVQNQS